jgi:virginiamycin B lyase
VVLILVPSVPTKVIFTVTLTQPLAARCAASLTNYNMNVAAESLATHRHTVANRLRRIRLLLALMAIAAAPAAAAEPTVYELPDATHAVPFGVGTDGTVWSALSRGHEWEGLKGQAVGSLAPDGTFAELSIRGFGHPVLDPAGGFWVVKGREYAQRRGPLSIARLAPSGKVEATYPVGRGRGGITAMAVTARAVWFARQRDGGRSSIERLSPADGSQRGFPLRPGYLPDALAVALDGAVRFTETDSGRTRIGWIANGGSVRRWQLTGRATHPISLTVGGEGTVWFGLSETDSRDFSTEKVGRITVAGDLSVYALPNGLPYSIAVGPEGRLWFQSSFGRDWDYRALGSISIDDQLSPPICADRRSNASRPSGR